MKQGWFISLEGIDGAGKSSHIASLAQAFRDQGHSVTVTREPGGTALAEKLRTLLLHERMDALTEALLAFAARRDHLQQVIAPALARGDVVLSDRFSDATFAYQGAGRGLEWSTLLVLECLTQTGFDLHAPNPGAPQSAVQPETLIEPDLTLWFDVPPQVAAQRLAGTRLPDRFEAQPEDFFARVAAGYALRAEQAPQRFVQIDGTQPPAQVWQQLHAALAGRGWLTTEVQP